MTADQTLRDASSRVFLNAKITVGAPIATSLILPGPAQTGVSSFALSVPEYTGDKIVTLTPSCCKIAISSANGRLVNFAFGDGVGLLL